MARNLAELEMLERRIEDALRPHTVDSVLCGLWNKAKPDGFPQPFMIAGTAQFALRFCAPAFRSIRPSPPLDWRMLSPIVDLVTRYLLTDPIGFDETVPSSLLSILLRTVGHQFPYASSFFGQHARALILYRDIPRLLADRKGVSKFDFRAAFEHVNGASVEDVIDIGYIAFCAAHSNQGFALKYFHDMRKQGMHVPGDDVIMAVLDKLSADPRKFNAEGGKNRRKDRRFAAYDSNPLFRFPIVRPWPRSNRTARAQDRMTVPLPELIPRRLAIGVYYEMRREYTDFLNYFGHLFEAYAGQVFRHCVPGKALLSESDIRAVYSAKHGKAPDWVVMEGDTAILIECKATRLSRLALAEGSEENIASDLKHVASGLKQLAEFTQACQAGKVPHPALRQCHAYCPVILTFEPLFLANSTDFRQMLTGLVDEAVGKQPWLILSLEELEQLQPHIAAGVAMAELFTKMRHQLFPALLENVHQQTGCTYKDTFLHQQEHEFYVRLGIAHKMAPRKPIAP